MTGTPQIGAIVLLAGFAAGSCLAASAYRPQYDFPDQGDDWYAGESAPNPRHDFPGTDIEGLMDGQDFGLGYEIRADVLGLGPPVELTNTSQYEYAFGLGALPEAPPPGGPECYDDQDCQDLQFCDGAELCDDGRCTEGPVPDCSDGVSCTIDICDFGLNSCVHVPVLKPEEVEGLTLRTTAPGGAEAMLDWFVRVPSDYYNVYRGELTLPGEVSCYESGLLQTTVNDDGTVAPQGLYVFLVTAYGCGAESTLGSTSASVERTSADPCP
jgi:hypothetical protein